MTNAELRDITMHVKIMLLVLETKNILVCKGELNKESIRKTTVRSFKETILISQCYLMFKNAVKEVVCTDVLTIQCTFMLVLWICSFYQVKGYLSSD